jgi:hypothetical protein
MHWNKIMLPSQWPKFIILNGFKVAKFVEEIKNFINNG